MAEAQVSGYQSHTAAPRERKFSAVELGPNGGVVELSDLSSENQALAQFGYKPVYTHPFHYCFAGNGKSVDRLWALDYLVTNRSFIYDSDQPINPGALITRISRQLSITPRLQPSATRDMSSDVSHCDKIYPRNHSCSTSDRSAIV